MENIHIKKSTENSNKKVNERFSINSAILFGWESMKKHFLFLVLVVVFDLLIILLPDIVSKITENIELSLSNVIFYFVFNLILWIISAVVSMGFLHITVLLSEGLDANFSDLFEKANRIINFVVSSILYAIIVTVGFILLIIPGIIFMARFQFYQYAVLEKNIGPIQALKASWRITKDQVTNLILFWIVVLFINVLGALALGIGLFITFPLTMIATAYVYKKLAN
jgi:uncharacterized membrane protein